MVLLCHNLILEVLPFPNIGTLKEQFIKIDLSHNQFVCKFKFYNYAKMYSKYLFCHQKPKSQVSDFFVALMQKNIQQNNKAQQKIQFYQRRIQRSIQKTKSMKKAKYINQRINSLSQESKLSEKSPQSSICSAVLSQLASYVKEKNSRIPWTKKYNWEQILISSQKSYKQIYKSGQKYNKKRLDFSFQSLTCKDEANNQKEYHNKEQTFSKTQSQNSIQQNTVNFDQIKEIANANDKSQCSSLNSSQLLSFIKNRNKDIQTQNKMNGRQYKNYVDDEQSDQLQQLVQKIVGQRLKPQSSTSLSEKEQQRVNKKQFFEFEFQFDQSFRHDESSSNATSSYKDKKTSIRRQEPIDRRSQYRLKRLKKAREQQTTCSICIDQIVQRSKLPCKHSFCHQCLSAWLQKHSNCPNCRLNAQYYTFQGHKHQIQQRQFQLQNYLSNIGGSDQQQDPDSSLDYVCYNCDQTNLGDDLIICDKCLVNSVHVGCDLALNKKMPPSHRNWYCHMCRLSPSLWYLQNIAHQ